MIEKTILVTGGAGFIGSNFVLDWLKKSKDRIVNLDLLTYAGNINNLVSIKNNSNHIFVKGDIADTTLVTNLFEQYRPWAIVNFAAESHVDRSILNSNNFIHTNIIGTYNLLEVARLYFDNLTSDEQKTFRFLHISTDEVYGSLEKNDPAFTEESNYEPNSPYSASKASSDHLVRAWFHTYALPTIITNCSNNYGPYQFPEKLIPLIITNALNGKNLPIYGDGQNIRDWLFVSDHCTAIMEVLTKGTAGEFYNIGGNNEKTNLEVVNIICSLLDELAPRPQNGLKSYSALINFVKDRQGHDRRYAINSNKIHKQLNWQPKESFETGIAKTVKWYLDNQEWIRKTGKL
ncbi:MAG: dTDP-glucose 4,6-dehydratase [Rickettsiaceae bacterium]